MSGADADGDRLAATGRVAALAVPLEHEDRKSVV